MKSTSSHQRGIQILTDGDNSLPANDDQYTSSIPVSVPFPFFGSSYSSIYVNNNGDVTFGTPLSQYTSQAFPITGSHKIIAPFWTDIDTRKGGYLWYRTTTNHTVLQRGTNKIHTLFPGLHNFSATLMMVVTWEDVAAYGCSDSGIITCQQWNTFQLVLITNGIHSFAVFNYNKITWTMSTQVGFNAGDGTHYYAVPGSMTDNMLNLPQMSNIGVPGQFVFRVDEREISNADIIDECISSPCMHGNCSDEYLHYVCLCEPGFTGVNCEKEVNKCASSPCRHGVCFEEINNYQCVCETGYYGRQCSYFNILYLWPLLIGFLLLLLSMLLLFLWKRYKRHCPEDEIGVFAFNDVTLGPGKSAFQSTLHVNKKNIHSCRTKCWIF